MIRCPMEPMGTGHLIIWGRVNCLSVLKQNLEQPLNGPWSQGGGVAIEGLSTHNRKNLIFITSNLEKGKRGFLHPDSIHTNLQIKLTTI